MWSLNITWKLIITNVNDNGKMESKHWCDVVALTVHGHYTIGVKVG